MCKSNYPQFITEDGFIEFWKSYLTSTDLTGKTVSIYVHFPWCRSVCKYCVFGTEREYGHENIIMPYKNTMMRLARNLFDMLDSINVIPDDIYFGGGTASRWGIESLIDFKFKIPHWNDIKHREIEVHPADISDDLINALISPIGFTRVSFGVQSFDHNSNVSQNRITADRSVLANAIDHLTMHNITTNVDLVYLFNGDTIDDHRIFIRDLDITMSEVLPTSITVSPNFRSPNFYKASMDLRYILKTIHENRSIGYAIDRLDSLTLDMDDVVKYRDIPYMLYRTFNGVAQVSSNLNEFTRFKDNEIVIGIGGIPMNVADSHTPDGYILKCQYENLDDEFVFELNQQNCETNEIENDIYNAEIPVGNYVIPSYHSTIENERRY